MVTSTRFILVDVERERTRPRNYVGDCCEKLRATLRTMVVLPDRGRRQGTWLLAWQCVTSLCMLACAYVIPFSLALPEVATNTLEMFNILFDCCFTMDIVLHFFIAVRHSSEGNQDDIWEKDPFKIARHYCGVPFSQGGRAGWFWVDAVSVVPGWLQVFGVGSTLVTVSFLRLIRMARLTGLLHKLELCQITTGLPFVVSDCMKFIFVTTWVSHMAACTWVMVEGKVTVRIFSTKLIDGESWLSGLITAKGFDPCTPNAEHDPICIYNLALYWAAMTLTFVGQGDILPRNTVEYYVCTTFMFIAGFFWAYIVGSVTELLSDLDYHNERFKHCVGELNDLMSQRRLSSGLQSKLRSFMQVSKDLGQLLDHQYLLESNLSEGLQREVAVESPVTHTILRKVFWAKDLEQDALLEILRSLIPCWYSPNETIVMEERMIVIREGIAAVKGRILGRNEVYGQNSIILQSPILAREPMPRTLSYVAAMVLKKRSLTETCMKFPSADKRLRTAQVRTAVWRGFVRAAMRLRVRQKRGASHRGFCQRSLSLGSHLEGRSFSASMSNSPARTFKDMERRMLQGQREMADEILEIRQLFEDCADSVVAVVLEANQAIRRSSLNAKIRSSA